MHVARLTDFVVFNDSKLAKRYGNGEKIPMSTLFEAYFDGKLDIPGDLYEFLDQRNLFVTYSLTPDHFKFLFTNFIPEVAIHSKEQDARIVRGHYDRGDDFFGAFLGERMVYTSAFFMTGDETLEQAQDNKLDLVCSKLMVKPGESFLDIGCGWGTLARHAAKKWGADATGVTISKNQTAFGNNRIKQWNVEDHARIMCLDYRDIPERQFDKIASLEMVEHVGVKNLPKFCDLVYSRLKDDGLFLLQWTGLRRGGDQTMPVIGLRPEDLIWGLFMNKYIFSGADASLPLSGFVKALETAGFEIHSAENISIHYGLTIKKWHDNWLKNKEQILSTYGERWFRIWHLFLGWSVRIAEQGNAACFQIVANKNLDHFNRRVFISQPSLGTQQKMFEERVPAAAKGKNGTHAAGGTAE
jgi:cyclopropane fatty-acyl-phospholipid synthase-like methyltransferase